MTTPDTSPPPLPEPKPYVPPEPPMVAEEADRSHYFFAPFTLVDFGRGEVGYEPVFFGPGQYGTAYVDLRDNATPETGYAFVRSPHAPAELASVVGRQVPQGVIYVGQSLTGPLPQDARARVRTVLGLRGQVATVKDAIRLVLLSEAGTKGKPGKLAPTQDGHLYVYLGDLRIDLAG